MNKVSLALVAMAAGLSMASGAGAATNLIENGSFENPTLAQGENYRVFTTSGPTIDHWTVTEGSVDLVTLDGVYGGVPEADANQLVDLIGTGTGLVGGIAQSFFAAAGKSYLLTFQYSDNYHNRGGGPAGALVTVTTPDFQCEAQDGCVNDAAIQLTAQINHTGAAQGNLAWDTFSGYFMGTGQLTTLTFTSNGCCDAGGIFLDDVSVQAVPEPATWALMIMGFGGAGAMLRRRRVATAAI